MYNKYRHLVLLIGFILIVDPIVTSHVNRKLKGSEKVKSNDDKTKGVSSDRVPNGGRKGPMSGSKNGQGLPLPIVVPFPLLPLRHKTKEKKKKKKQATEEHSKSNNKKILHDDSNRKIKLPRTKSSESQKSGDFHIKTYKNVNKTLIRTNIDHPLTRLKRSFDDTDDADDEEMTDEQIRSKIRKRLQEKKENSRFKRTLESNDQELSDEEWRTAEDWLNEDNTNLVPGLEEVSFFPNELDFIWQGHSVLSNAYKSLMPRLNIYKRSAENEAKKNNENDVMLVNSNAEKEVDMGKRDADETEDSDNVNLMLINAAAEFDRKIITRDISPEEESAKDSEEALNIVNEDADFADVEQDRETRNAAIADEPPMSVEDAERQLDNAELASAALTRLELGIGIDPEHLVSNTHKYVDSLQAEKARYDEDIRSHIEKAQEAEKRASIAVHDEISKKSEISKDVAAAKRQLDIDKRKIEEINTELKQLKDIELMATGLEVAKYMAKERAKHNLEYAQARATINQQSASAPLPVMPVVQVPPVASVMSMPAQQPMIAPPTMMTAPTMYQPVGTDTEIPSFGVVQSETSMFHELSNDQQPTPDVQIHQLGDQRNAATRPETSPLQLPLTQYFTKYLQSKNLMQNQFAILPRPNGPSVVSPFVPSIHPVYKPYNRPIVPEEYHVGGDQRHAPARAPETIYMIKPMNPSVIAPATFMTSFTKVPRPNNVGISENDITDIEQSPGHSYEDEKQPNAALWFPGPTYSPPPSWNHNIPEPYMRTQPSSTKYYQPPLGQTLNIPEPHSTYSVPQTPTPLAEALTAISPVNQFSEQSFLSSAPVSAAYTTAQALVVSPDVPFSESQPAPYAPLHTYQSSIFPESTMEMRPGSIPLVQAYTQQAKAGQVITEFPPDEVITINKKIPPQPRPPPPPDMSGTLPGWMGAVDSAKYDNDVSDRLRQRNVSRPNEKPEDSQNPIIKREYLRLINAETNLQNVNKAANAVTHIEAAIGFDPGSIAKMVDFVKTAAKKDVKLSEEAVDKDKLTLQKVEGDNDIVKKSEITKKSDVDSVALEHARSKLKTDEAVLADARDRLDKINKMEMIVTEIEVAKFYASMKAESDVQGAKRTLEALKRNDVTRPQ